ncbi:hypothetical protein [Nitrosomonas sp.]|uniref:hypothetical protein n=1 Tax=Nitrosomonas sp. TaxID=42353 RepID=UPI0025D128FC|nr:hypothetical protein [Nitrosomonas sp.]
MTCVKPLAEPWISSPNSAVPHHTYLSYAEPEGSKAGTAVARAKLKHTMKGVRYRLELQVLND